MSNSSRASSTFATEALLAARTVSGPIRVRRVLTALLALGLLVMTGCGMDVQTTKPYTPAQGVNFDVSSSGNYQDVVHVRNLAVVSRTPGQGFLTGTVIANSADAMTGVSGTAIKTDGTNGSALTASLASPVEVGRGTPVVLTTLSPLITFSSVDLKPGLEAVVTLEFRKAGSSTVRVPVIDGSVQSEYASISPSPSASDTPVTSPTP